MSDATYIRSEIDAKPEWELAFAISEIMNDNAPIGWGQYIFVAKCLLYNYNIQRKRSLDSAPDPKEKRDVL